MVGQQLFADGKQILLFVEVQSGFGEEVGQSVAEDADELVFDFRVSVRIGDHLLQAGTKSKITDR